MQLPAVSILSYLVGATYQMQVSPIRETAGIVGIGSVRIQRTSRGPDFRPDPTSCCAIHSALILVTCLTKIELFSTASALLGAVSAHANAQVVKLLDYLRLWIAYRRNDYQVIADWDPHCGASQSPFSSHFGAKFDPGAGTIRVLSRAFINSGDWESGLLWAEFFLKCRPAANPGELAKAFQLRGSALVLALERSLSVCGVTSRNTIAREAITSFYVASHCYQRVGRSYEDVYCRLMLVDLMQDWSGFAAGRPRWFTDVGAFDLKIEYRTLDVTFVLKDLEVAVKRLLDPLFVIHTQVCCARQ
jgi:hypothetical protein